MSRSFAICSFAFIVISIGAFLPAASAGASFGPPAHFSAGEYPQGLSSSDLNGDALPDIVTANTNSNDVSVLLGNGDGTFAPAVQHETGASPHSVTVGDFNNDGLPDMVTANAGANSVSVLLGSGAGDFNGHVEYPITGAFPCSITSGDIDGDGIADLITANAGSNDVSVLYGTGAGTFVSGGSFATGFAPFSVATADFDGDGHADLVTANLASNDVSVLLGSGGGSFGAAGHHSVGANPREVVIADVDQDSHLDLITANSNDSSVSVLRGNGGGSFAAAERFEAGNTPFSLAVGLLDDDALPDLVVANSYRLAVLTGTGAGSFGSPDWYQGNINEMAVAISDLNGDWSGDIVVANASSNDVSVLLNEVPGNPADDVRPEITIDEPSPRERYVLGQHVPADFGCEDPPSGSPPYASGIKTCEGPGTVDTSRLGNFTYTVTAEDNAGNTSSRTHSYAVDPPRYPNLVSAGDPIAFYRLGDALGATVMTDSSGNNRHGQYKNGIALKRPAAPNCQRRPHAPYVCDLTSDPEDRSAFFPARDGYGFANNIAAPQSAYTLEAWIKRADDKAHSIIGQGGAGQLFVNSDGRLALRQTQDTVTSSGPTLTPGEWFHVAATWDGHTTRLYVNGKQVGSSNSANKPPSGSSTLYVGYGDQAPWFHGQIDEAAYYGTALPGGAFATRYAVGTARDVPGPEDGPPIQRPEAHIESPVNGGLYAPTKVPPLAFRCEDLDGDDTVSSCVATVDDDPVTDGAALPDDLGEHVVTVTATDDTGLTRSHTHRYKVESFDAIYRADHPIVYYRLGDEVGSVTMADSSGNHRNGTWKNAQESGPVGISGDGDRSRRFHGSSGYGFTNNVTAPTTQGSIEAWVNPDDSRDQSVAGHGDAGEIFIEGGVFKFRHMGTTVAAHIGPEPGRFTQVVAVWDGVTISLYVDGELRAQTEATRRPSSSSTFYVGYGEIKPWFKGSLDEVAYYGTALSPERILQHFLADPPPNSDEPEVLTPDDTAPDDTAPDADDLDSPTPIGGGDAVLPRGGAAESVGKTAKKAQAKKRAKARARAKCRKLGKAKKRKACLRRVNRR